MKSTLNVVGIMNGTSIDGADFVLCKISRSNSKVSPKCQLLGSAHIQFSLELTQKLRSATQHRLKVDELALLHHDLGRFYAESLLIIKKRKKWKIDLIGVHGQTVFHAAPQATLQIGEASYLRAAIGVPVVCDFRPMDIAFGGQGAPLATLFHRDVLSKCFESPVAVQNLGGIANVSYFDGKKISAFDTGPANMLIDMAARRFFGEDFDRNGDIAARGVPKANVILKWLTHPYFSQKPPKSCGREEFGELFLEQALKDLGGCTNEDKIATLTEFTARSLADAYSRFFKKLPKVIILCGGGAKNTWLKGRIQFLLPKSCVITSEDAAWPVETIEGAAFALLAAYRVWEIPSNIPETTGAKSRAVLGKLL